MSEESEELLTVSEARQELGVNKVKMADLIKRGDLPVETSPFDRRIKWIKRADLEALKARMPRTLKSAA